MRISNEIFRLFCDRIKCQKNMKNYRIVLLVLLLAARMKGYSQTDEQLITNTLNDFLEGGTNGEVERFKNAFLRDAVQKAMGNNGVTGMTVESLASKIKPNQKMDRTTRVLSVSYANNAATAITETVYATNKIIDFLNLLKVGNDWKIVSRVYSRVDLNEQVSSMGDAPVAKTQPAVKPKAAPAKPAKKVADDGW